VGVHRSVEAAVGGREVEDAGVGGVVADAVGVGVRLHR